MNMNVMRCIAVIGTALLLGACASAKMSGPTLDIWNKMSETEQQSASEAAGKRMENFDSWWDNIAMPLYMAHDPVPLIGTGDTHYTMQWIKTPGKYDQFVIYMKHDPDGIEAPTTSTLYSSLAKKDGTPTYQHGAGGAVRPNKLLENVSSAEDVAKLFIRGGFQVLGAGANGIGPALVNAANDCGDNCGNTNFSNVVQGVSAASNAAAEAASNNRNQSVLGSCPGAGCLTDF